MSVKVVEAIGDENGGSSGGTPGDQTGNEILVRTFKKRSYEFTECLRCIDRKMAINAAENGTRIALCASFGYSQTSRWSGPKNIEKAGGVNAIEQAEPGDFDCSTLVLESYRLAGLPIKMTGYTGNIRKILLDTGLFVDVDLSDIEDGEIGDLMNAPTKHVLMLITDGANADPEPVEYDYIEIIRGKVNVRNDPGLTGRICHVAKKGETFPYLGYGEEDERGVFWWAVDYKNAVRFISSANQDHAILVEVDYEG